jgi:hypothetical protein
MKENRTRWTFVPAGTTLEVLEWPVASNSSPPSPRWSSSPKRQRLFPSLLNMEASKAESRAARDNEVSDSSTDRQAVNRVFFISTAAVLRSTHNPSGCMERLRAVELLWLRILRVRAAEGNDIGERTYRMNQTTGDLKGYGAGNVLLPIQRCTSHDFEKITMRSSPT